MATGGDERGQAALLMLGVLCALLVGTAALFGLGRALAARGHAQRAADLAAISAGQAMARAYPRLFEPASIGGAANPRHLSQAAYLSLARAAAERGAERNGVAAKRVAVSFPAQRGAGETAPTRVAVAIGEEALVVLSPKRREQVRVSARATAEIGVDSAGGVLATEASGAGYAGPLAYRQGKPMRPDVARAFDRMAVAARREAGLALIVTSGYRSDAEQARLFAAHPDPRWVARPGTSLHRFGTELDLGPPPAYAWLAANARRFGFVQRYGWEPWHYGYTLNAGSVSVGFGATAGGERTAGGLPAFVPPAYRAALARAAQRWNVGAALLAAQLYVESGFDPLARSSAGAEGIAQFMPGTAAALGLADPFDAEAAIDAQGHLMRDLLRRFASVPLALAGYNAGAGSVAACMCIPPIPETQTYVARILGLLGGIGDMAPPALEVKLVA